MTLKNDKTTIRGVFTRMHQLCSADGNRNDVKSIIEAQDKAWVPLIGSCRLFAGSRDTTMHGNASLTVRMWSLVINREHD